MPLRAPTPLSLLLFAALALTACECGMTPPAPPDDGGTGEVPLADAGEAPDAGEASDAGEAPDAGDARDGGEPADAGAAPDAGAEVSIAGTVVTEGDAGTSQATLVVTLSGAPTGTVTASWETSDVTASGQTDYVPASGALTFLPGETQKHVTVDVLGDAFNEADETFAVRLTGASGARLATAQAEVTIRNDDPLPSLAVADVAVLEGAGAAVLSVSLSAASGRAVTVDWATAPGTATAADFTAASGTLTFAPGDTTRTVSVALAADALDEADEDFTVTLTAPAGAALADATAVATITDDDDAPLLSINDIRLAEGNAGTTAATFTVSLSAASGRTVSVQYVTQDGTAAAGADFTPASGTLTFAPGVLSQSVAVLVVGDATAEADETFTVALASPVNATLGQALGTGTITNDDGTGPALTIADVSVMEPAGTGQGVAAFTVTLAPAHPTSPVTVAWSTQDGTATAGADYVAGQGTLTFPAGVTTQTVSVTLQGDALDEPDEAFQVTLATPTNAVILDGAATATVQDDDAAPTLSISNASVAEGAAGSSSLALAVVLSAPSGRTVTAAWTTADGTAQAPTDYLASSGTLTFAPGQTAAVVLVPVNGDTLPEADETLTVTLSGATNATLAVASAVGTLTNDDAAPTVSVSDVAALEGHLGLTAFAFTVSLSGPSGQSVSVDWSTVAGTATAQVDFLSASGTLTFAPGVQSQTVTVQVVGDTADEGNETFTVQLAAPVRATLGDAQGQGVILNDDSTLPSLSVGDVTAGENAAALVFTVSLTPASPQTVTVAWSTQDGTATAGADYVTASGVLSFAPGETVKTVSVSLLGDTLDEANETLLVHLASAVNATVVDAQGQGTITDDDAMPALTVSDASTAEGASGTTPLQFTVTLSAVSGRTVTVNYATADGTARSSGTPGTTDYVGVSGTLSFPPGTTSQAVTVSVVGDTLDEANEGFTITLSSAANASLADPVGQGTILDDDAPPSLSIADVQGLEGDTGVRQFSFNVALSAPSGQDVTVAWATASGTATGGSSGTADFVSASGTLTFVAGEQVKAVTVQVRGDFAAEADETFTVTLSSPVNATLLDAQGTGTILNDD